jgi:hypothetical protein
MDEHEEGDKRMDGEGNTPFASQGEGEMNIFTQHLSIFTQQGGGGRGGGEEREGREREREREREVLGRGT